MTARLRVIQGSRGIPNAVLVRQTTLDDLISEVAALDAEALELVERALPLARQLGLMANALGPSAGATGRELIGLLERHHRQHSPERAA